MYQIDLVSGEESVWFGLSGYQGQAPGRCPGQEGFLLAGMFTCSSSSSQHLETPEWCHCKLRVWWTCPLKITHHPTVAVTVSPASH